MIRAACYDLPCVHIAETAEDGTALGFYALVLGDKTVQFIEHGEHFGVEMPLAAFWRMVAELEEAGFRDGRRVTAPAPTHLRRPKRGTAGAAVREFALSHDRFKGRDCADALCVSPGTVTCYLAELVHEGLIESRKGRNGGYARGPVAPACSSAAPTATRPARTTKGE